MRPTPRVNPIVFKDSQEAYYLLGVGMSDGCIVETKTGKTRCAFAISLSVKDELWLKAIQKFYFPDTNINRSISKKKTGDFEMVKIQIQNQDLVEWFLNKGCVQRKSRIIELPEIPDEYFFDFLRGFIDGDGSVSLTHRIYKNGFEAEYLRIRITTGSENFAKQLAEKIRNLKIAVSLTKREFKPSENFLAVRGGLKYIIDINSNNAIKLANLIYHDAFRKDLCLKRKYEIVKNAININNKRQKEINKKRIMTEEKKQLVRSLRAEGYSLGVIAKKTGLYIQQFSPYVKDIKPEKVITLKNISELKKFDSAMPYVKEADPENFINHEYCSVELHLMCVKKSHPLFAKWFFEHYPGSRGIWGKNINYLILKFGKPIGVIGFAQMPKKFNMVINHTGIEDEDKILNNNIFRLIESDKNLGTRVLKLARKRIKEEYKSRYKIEIQALMTFVEPPRTGVVYSADNWTMIGETQGMKRIGKLKYENSIKKLIYVYKYN